MPRRPRTEPWTPALAVSYTHLVEAATGKRNLSLDQAGLDGPRLPQQAFYFRQYGCDRLTSDPLGGVAALREQFFSGWIERGNFTFWPDANDRDRNARKNRLGEETPLVNELACRDQAMLLEAQFRGHFVEGLTKMGKIAL